MRKDETVLPSLLALFKSISGKPSEDHPSVALQGQVLVERYVGIHHRRLPCLSLPCLRKGKVGETRLALESQN